MIDNFFLQLSFFWPFNVGLIFSPALWMGLLYNGARLFLVALIPIIGLPIAANLFMWYVLTTIMVLPFALIWNLFTLLPAFFVDILLVTNIFTIVDCVYNHKKLCHFMTGGDKTHHHHEDHNHEYSQYLNRNDWTN